MPEYTYQTRRKLTETWIDACKQKAKHLSEWEQKMLPEPYVYATPQDVCQYMKSRLENGAYDTLSGLYKTEFAALVKVCVPEKKHEEFYYALDQMNQFQMTAGWYRRSLRSGSYVPFADQSIKILRAYSRLEFYQASLADVLTGNLSPELYDHARNEYFSYAQILAAQIDRGDQAVISAVTEILLGEGNTLMISHELIRGIVMCKNEELYCILGKFLLAARLQEGARQAVCETMDAGRPEAFLHLFSVIEEHGLIRYSSVKRAVATWIGIFSQSGPERVSEKLLHLMGRCLREKEFCKEQLALNDSIAVSCALWAIGFYDANQAVLAVKKLIAEGSRHQKMTASYFLNSLQDEKQKMQASKDVILRHSDDLGLVSCFLPHFLSEVNTHFYRLIQQEDDSYSRISKKVKQPAKMPPETLFSDRAQAKECYRILKELLPQIPKKGLLISPCIFPWHEVELTQSAVASRLCLIAHMLSEQPYIDDAAKLVKVVGQGEGRSYYSLSRAAVASVLLYRPKTEICKDVLFELLHNAEESTNEQAYYLVDDMELSEEDFIKIEKNLKYKKGRSKALSLLKKQDGLHIAQSIKRLLLEKSEECHMGALDLALQLKKEDKKQFDEVRPHLAALKNPTGKERVLLEELSGEQSVAQEILNTEGYGLYDIKKEWVLPPIAADGAKASELFVYGEDTYLCYCKKLDQIIRENRELSYSAKWEGDVLLGNELKKIRYSQEEDELEPLDEYPFRKLWEEFYEKEALSPQLLLELGLYRKCCMMRSYVEQNIPLYKQVFGQNLPFGSLSCELEYASQVWTVFRLLESQYTPKSLKAAFALCGASKYLSVLDTSNDIFTVEEKRWDGSFFRYTEHTAGLPVFQEILDWLSYVEPEDWGSAFSIKFKIEQHYSKQKDREISRYTYGNYPEHYVGFFEYVKCYVKGIWDKDLFYKAVFTFWNLGTLLLPVSAVEQKGAISLRRAFAQGLNLFFGQNVIRPVNGKYCFEEMGNMPEMAFAHELYQELVPLILSVELKRGEQSTPFSDEIGNIKVVYGVDYMIQILTALGKDPLQRGFSYYSNDSDRRAVLSHLLKVSMPKPDETAADLKRALKGSDITKKRLAELAMYADQWIPLIQEYLKIKGFASACYYFMAHTSEGFTDELISILAKYTPLSPEELADGAFDIHWFKEAYKSVGEKNFKLLYDAAKYSSSGTAHGRARKYADAALGNVELDTVIKEIESKRNKDWLMAVGLFPLPSAKKKKEEELLRRYQFIQKFKKESRQFGAQRRASEGRAAEIALRNLSVNAGFTDVMRLTLRMEGKLAEQSKEFFTWKPVGEIELLLSVDEYGQSALQCRKDGKLLKTIPAKYKKNEIAQKYQAANKQLKEQRRRAKQMMEQAMEDGTVFEVWEFLEMYQNPVTRPITETLIVRTNGKTEGVLGFLTKEGILDADGILTPVRPGEKICIAHPYDLYAAGCWQDYQKLLFEQKIKQPFKQAFRELYLKLEEELPKEHSMLFAGNQIWPKKTLATLRGRRWVADYEDGLQKIYYKENIVACIYAMADWFTPSDIEPPTLEYVAFSDRKTGLPLTVKEIPDIIYSEVMRDVDLAVSVAYAGGVDPETSHSTIEMRRTIAEYNAGLFGLKNVRFQGSHALIDGTFGQYSIHLGSGVIHQIGKSMIFAVPVHSQQKGRIFLPFLDDDPKTAEILSKILLFAEDSKIKDPKILSQIQ